MKRLRVGNIFRQKIIFILPSFSERFESAPFESRMNTFQDILTQLVNRRPKFSNSRCKPWTGFGGTL